MSSGPEPLPAFLERRSTDEYEPAPYSDRDLTVVAHSAASVKTAADRLRLSARALAKSRRGTAAGLRALNAEYGADFFTVPPEAESDDAAAEETFSGPETVVDVQTHFMSPHSLAEVQRSWVTGLYRSVMPPWWTDITDDGAYDLATYIQKIFVETESVVNVLTSSPLGATDRVLFNDEMANVRRMVDEFASSKRLLNHAIIVPGVPGEIEAMERWRDDYGPVGWKCYTANTSATGDNVPQWMLDDQEHGLPFLQRAQDLDVNLVCIHKGISKMVDNGSPRDIGPAARAFPGINIVVYHSGWEFPSDLAPPEGAYAEEVAQFGVNRLIKSCRDAGIGRGGNVFAELGTTWFSIIRRPVEAAHVIGKLIAYFGEDNVLWGSDSIWYGSPQPLIDAFRTFQIPDDMCAKFGYTPLTPATKAKILGLNAARLYGIDIAAARQAKEHDDRAWAAELLHEVRQRGFAGIH